jgi:FdhD protein
MQIIKLPIKKFSDNRFSTEDDTIIVEKPLDIFVNGNKRFAITRLPGNNVELSVGLCYHKGLINSYGDIKQITEDTPESNRVDIETVVKDADQATAQGDTVKTIPETCKVPAQELFTLFDDFSSRQQSFDGTGGTHAIAIYNTGRENIAFSEDIGRHNSFDKCIGRVVMDNKNEDASIAILSSRINQEMVSKACRIGLEIVAGVSAPTSFAVELAKKSNMTLIGFLRKKRFSIYSVPERITE